MVCHVVRLVFMWSVMWLGWCLCGVSRGYVGVYVVCHVVRLNKINKINLYSAKSSLKTIQGALHVHDNMFLKRITQMYN